MTELAESPSTVLEPQTTPDVSGGGDPGPAPAEPKEETRPSLRDTIAAAVKDDAKEPAKDDADGAGEKAGKAEGEKDEADEKDKPEAKAKTERAADGKFKGADKPAENAGLSVKEGEPGEKGPEGAAKPDAADKGGSEHYQPPKSLLPDAREKWTNVPRAVQRDIDNMAREHEVEVTQLREATQRYDAIRPFDELAHRNGRDLRESLATMHELENTLRTNPIAGLNRVLMEVGPRKADGQPYSLYEVAQAVTQQGPEGYQRMVAQGAPQQPPPQNDNPEIERLKAEKAQLEVRYLADTVIEPFKAAHPRYEELKSVVAKFLNSDMVPRSLSPSDRLAAAYDMAERIHPPSHVEPASKDSPDPARRADESFSGSTSIKSAPGAITPVMDHQRGGSTRDILRQQMKKAKVS